MFPHTSISGFFDWSHPGVYQYSGAPRSGYLRLVKPFVLQFLPKGVIWIDFPRRYESYAIGPDSTSESLSQLVVYTPTSLEEAVLITDDLEMRWLAGLTEKRPHLIVADLPLWYAIEKRLGEKITKGMVLILHLLSFYASAYGIKVLMINELRQTPENGEIRPVLESLVLRFVTQSFQLERSTKERI